MPSGLKRFQQAEALHFITFSCFHRLPLLDAPCIKEMFEAVLEQTRGRHEPRIYAYVLMPEHVHLLVNEPPRILLAQFLKSLKQMTSRKLRGQRSQFWQTRYYDTGGLGMVQLSPLRNRSPRRCGDRIGMDGKTASPTHRDKAAMNGAQPILVTSCRRA